MGYEATLWQPASSLINEPHGTAWYRMVPGTDRGLGEESMHDPSSAAINLPARSCIYKVAPAITTGPCRLE